MVVVIDTSSVRAGIAVLTPGGEVAAESVRESARDLDLAAAVRELVDLHRLTQVVCATGPGSFTGLRLGAAFAVGLAMGLGIPLGGLPTLELAAARAREPARGVAEAGRGRVYFQGDGGAPQLGEAAQVPRDRPVSGWLRPATALALAEAGVRLLAEDELRSFGEAAGRLLGDARNLDYNGVELEYVQSFGPLR
jgi:tRNA threonylcarbamoyl adenosine modification protein YeaZ